jgi:lipopolysaccharide transport system permease protein
MVRQSVPWTIVVLPLVLLPLVLTTAGLVWLLASLGVFVRDLGQFVGLLTMSLLFLSPIFYPLSAVPDAFRPWMGANPLTGIIEEARKVAIRGEWPDWILLGIYLLVGAAAAHLGLVLFTRARRAFADVL